MPAKSRKTASDSSATTGFEQKLWLTADKLRNNIDAAEYKHVIPGLILLKYISDTFEEHRAKLPAGQGDCAGANAEDPDEYKAENVFWVPADACSSHLGPAPSSPPSARPWSTQWPPLIATTRISRDRRKEALFIPSEPTLIIFDNN